MQATIRVTGGGRTNPKKNGTARVPSLSVVASGIYLPNALAPHALAESHYQGYYQRDVREVKHF